VYSGGGNLSACGSAGLFRTGEAVAILGVSRRRILYWAHTGLVRPSRRTRGGHHRYSFQDLIALKAAKRLLDGRISLQRVRRIIRVLQQRLPHVDRPLSQLVLVATGDVVLVFRENAAFEALSGQEWIFDVARFQREIEGWTKTRRSRVARQGGVSDEARSTVVHTA
jgi:DNA-binding transcriptional MerR regulator